MDYDNLLFNVNVTVCYDYYYGNSWVIDVIEEEYSTCGLYTRRTVSIETKDKLEAYLYLLMLRECGACINEGIMKELEYV